MSNTKRWAAALSATLMLATPATANAVVHPGAGYQVERGKYVGQCSMAHVYEVVGQVYGLTAGHCAKRVGEEVVMEDAPHERGVFVTATDPIGQSERTSTTADLDDWAVIQFAPGTAASNVAQSTFRPQTGIEPLDTFIDRNPLPLRSFPRQLTGQIRDLEANPIRQGEILFKQGRTTGWTPVFARSQSVNDVIAVGWVQPGDSGGVLYDMAGNTVGITSRVADGESRDSMVTAWQRADVAMAG